MKFIPDALSSKFGTLALNASSHSPKILFAAGIVGFVGTTVLAARATLKVSDILEEHEDRMSHVASLEHRDASYADSKTARKDKTVILVHTALGIAKNYAPALLLGSLSVAALVGSHGILLKRNAGLTAAYVTIDKAFKEYRGRVVKEVGDDKEKHIYLGVEKQDVETTNADGTKTVVKKKVATGVSPYGRLFTEQNPNYQARQELNVFFLRACQEQLNDNLNSKGYVTLNQVYELLGFEPTDAGMVVGWLKDGGPDRKGDGVIDFGIFEDKDQLRVYDYMIGREREIYVDFNVDGTIYGKVGSY